jgi:NTP pyrophosphatase (non-canonical NTP hydrolase)
MNFEEYQKKSRKTALYPGVGSNFVYPTLGLAGEAGEVAEKVKKIIRDDGGEILPEKKKEISKELGDVLWYVSQIATEVGLSLDDVAKENIEKLYSRLERGKIGGSGDNR